MTSTTHMRKALALAQQGVRLGHGGPFGAVIVRGGAIVGEGWNQVLKEQDPTCHAEVVAIRDACGRLGTFDLSGCEIYASSEPCPMCLGAIYWARLERLYFCNTGEDAAAFGFRDEFIYAELGKPPTERTLPTARVPVPDALDVFHYWRRESQKSGKRY